MKQFSAATTEAHTQTPTDITRARITVIKVGYRKGLVQARNLSKFTLKSDMNDVKENILWKNPKMAQHTFPKGHLLTIVEAKMGTM